MSYENNRKNGGGRGPDSRDSRSSPSGRGSSGRPPQSRSGSQNNPLPSRGRPPSSSRRVSASSDTGEIDRYHYVDRDIYSSSNGKKGGFPPNHRYEPPPKRKKGMGKKIVIIILCVVVAVILAAASFLAIMMSRVKRQEVDTTSYIQTPADAPSWDVMSDDGVMNILLIGYDTDPEGTSRSDTMMLVSLDSRHKTMKMASFLRDLYLEIPNHGKDKLNASFNLGGAGLTMQTLENNFRINIDRYVMTDFESFADMIDLMGGIEVEMTQEEADYMNEIKGSDLSEGKNRLRGTLALYYSRMRYLDSDFARTGRQRQVILAMMDKLKKLNLLETTGFLYNYLPYITTNLSTGELATLATMAKDISSYKTETMYMPYKGTYQDVNKAVGEVLVPDLEENCRLLREFLYPDKAGSSASSKKTAAYQDNP